MTEQSDQPPLSPARKMAVAAVQNAAQPSARRRMALVGVRHSVNGEGGDDGSGGSQWLVGVDAGECSQYGATESCVCLGLCCDVVEHASPRRVVGVGG